MEIEQTPKSKRLLQDHKLQRGDRDGTHHINPAFSEDDEVCLSGGSIECQPSKTNTNVVAESGKGRGPFSTPETKPEAVIRRDDRKLNDTKNVGHINDQNNTANPFVTSNPRENDGESFKTDSTERQMKEHAEKLAPLLQSHHIFQYDTSKEAPVINDPKDFAKAHVEFKLGKKHLQKSDRIESNALKNAEKLAFQNSCLINNLDSSDTPHTCQTRNDLQVLRQNFQENKNQINHFAEEVHEDEEADEFMKEDLYQPSWPQRNWTAYKSALSFQTRSLSTFGSKHQPTHLSLAARSLSMRVPRQKPLLKSASDTTGAAPARKLLRQLSFSDSDAKNIRDYGSLQGGRCLPRRESKPSQDEFGTLDDEKPSEELKLPPAALTSLLGLMEELLARGKIGQIAIFSQTGGAPILSLPTSWVLSTNVATGLVKAVMETSQLLIRHTIDDQVYVCLKHGPHRMVGRSENNNVLVAQKTRACVVLGLSDDDTPGSCLHEVCALVDILTEKGY